MTGPGAPASDRLDGRTLLALVAMAVSVLVIANDFTALSVALPAIQSDFDTDLTTTQWVINAYAVVFGVLIVPGGRLADTWGRRQVFYLGSAIFATFSLLGGLAPGIGWLIACRAVMGIGAAMMWPAILGMTYALLPDAKAGLAGGLILGSAGFGNAVGPLLGGTLTDTVGWRWVFFVNVPIAAAAILITWATVHTREQRDDSARIDLVGVVVLTVGLVALLIALDEGVTLGWTDPFIVALFAVGLVALAALAFVERRAGDNALVPPDVLATRAFTVALVVVLLMSAIFFAVLVFLPQYFTAEFGWSAVQAGAGLLPLMGTFAVVSFVAGPLYARVGPKVIVSTGAACLTVGLVLLAVVGRGTSYGILVPGMMVLGVGIGLFYSSITTAGVTALDPSRSSLAGAIIYMCQIAGGSVGLGLNTAIVTSAPSLPEGLARALIVDAVLALIGLVVSLLFVGGRVDPHRIQAMRGHHRAHA